MTTFTPSIRPAYWSEQPRMAAVCTAAFWDSELFGDFFHPYRKQYPKDYDLYWLRNNQLDWFNPRHHFIVGVVPDKARPGKDLVVGVAQWERLGDGGKGPWNPFVPLLKRTMKLWVRISSWIWPNRAADPSRFDIFEKSWPYIQHLWTGDRAKCWDLRILAVHPSYGSMGIGRKLVKWGLDRADAEGVAASVKMAPGKERFYEMCGYHPEIVGRGGQGDGNPMAEIGTGGNIFFKDPKR